jgi:enterochelin esterase-like enzyme
MKHRPRRLVTCLLFGLLMAFAIRSTGQEISVYQYPTSLSVSSAALKDTEHLELVLPKEFNISQGRKFPVLFVFDKQNSYIYKNTLANIDFLTAMGRMPACIIVGIGFTGANRNIRTLPKNVSKKGKADELLGFLLDELYPLLEKQYQASTFKLFIGHSRTAIFSSHAISVRPKDINGIIASSCSYFDFDNKAEKEYFDQAMPVIAGLGNRFYFFSTGDSLSGDLHHASVLKLDQYLRSQQLPGNFIWKSYFLPQADHFTSPAMTVPQALTTIFDRQGNALTRLFKIPFTADTTAFVKVWKAEFDANSAYYDYTVTPTSRQFTSLSSHYEQVGTELGEERYNMSKFILQMGLRYFPGHQSFYVDLADLYEREGNSALVTEYRKKALLLTNIYYTRDEQAACNKALKNQLNSVTTRKK